MLWLKSFHIFFIICWSVGIFYLPRIFVYWAEADNQHVKNTLSTMARRLWFFITPFAIAAIACGIALTSNNYGYFFSSAWFHLKMLCVITLIAYHISCYFLMRSIASHRCTKSPRFFRYYNEAPVQLLLLIIFLIVFKPDLI